MSIASVTSCRLMRNMFAQPPGNAPMKPRLYAPKRMRRPKSRLSRSCWCVRH